MRDGEPWFVAKDLCTALEIKNSRDSLGALGEDEKGVALTDTLGGQQKVAIVSEGGMWTLVLRCRDAVTPGTVPFRVRKWVTSEVLPTIRKTGGYAKPTVDAERIRLAHAMASEAAVQVERTVFDAVMNGDAQLWRHSRYLLNLNYDRDSKPSIPWCGALPFEALAITIDELPERLTGPDAVSATDVQLARLAAACSQRLERRAQQREEKESTRPGAVLFKCTEPGKLTRA